MFSSNQTLDISGSMNQLPCALKFAMDMYDADETDHLVYQTTDDGRYIIGKICDEPEKGWNEFPFDFDIQIVSAIIVQFLTKQQGELPYQDSGASELGFLMTAVPECLGDELNGIKEPFWGIVSFKPFTCFYSD